MDANCWAHPQTSDPPADSGCARRAALCAQIGPQRMRGGAKAAQSQSAPWKIPGALYK